MLKKNLKIYSLVLIVLCFAYVNSQAQSAQPSNKIVETETSTYFINAQGDTVPYGVLLPIRGNISAT